MGVIGLANRGVIMGTTGLASTNTIGLGLRIPACGSREKRRGNANSESRCGRPQIEINASRWRLLRPLLLNHGCFWYLHQGDLRSGWRGNPFFGVKRGVICVIGNHQSNGQLCYSRITWP